MLTKIDTTGPLGRAFLSVLIQMADDHLILGHRLSEWCGHAPILEEDLSMPNMALDLIGQARELYAYAAEFEGKGRDEDDIAYLRSEREYRNCLLVERPNGDFAHTMLRQMYFAAYMQQFWAAFSGTQDARLGALAAKAKKEVDYHVRHSAQWVIRLGDGTDESARRMQTAVDDLHPYVSELFDVTDEMRLCVDASLVPDPIPLRLEWDRAVETVLARAKVVAPDVTHHQRGGRSGRHGEEFGFLLAELQYLQRAYPGVEW